MSKKNAISFVRNEPAFIQKFKEKVGYKEDVDVNAKRAKMPDFDEDDDSPEKDDEKPMVVVLKKGDLTADEANNEQKALDSKADDEAIADGKITFKKPEKRSSESTSDLNTSSAKKKKDSIKSLKSNSKKVNDKKLLSFGDEEEEDDT
ncbi:uncharacterized protein KIAA1143 homolog [Mytilus californianus]|uniref:uncharacterized protein KIAA1143 homolog n=1 Tax=Mytilus californianus TaxID=6549 RepID=UPI002246DE15|nr:uncharacterized protein KIAA1143 homolog [Mytilus californianus]